MRQASGSRASMTRHRPPAGEQWPIPSDSPVTMGTGIAIIVNAMPGRQPLERLVIQLVVNQCRARGIELAHRPQVFGFGHGTSRMRQRTWHCQRYRTSRTATRSISSGRLFLTLPTSVPTSHGSMSLAAQSHARRQSTSRKASGTYGIWREPGPPDDRHKVSRVDVVALPEAERFLVQRCRSIGRTAHQLVRANGPSRTLSERRVAPRRPPQQAAMRLGPTARPTERQRLGPTVQRPSQRHRSEE
jgi:hypothetical protein